MASIFRVEENLPPVSTTFLLDLIFELEDGSVYITVTC
jgi:hypothetical protein